MKRLSSAVLASALLLLTHGPAQGQEKIESTPYYPLEVGNTWHYKVGENRYIVKVERLEKVGKAGKEVLCYRLETIVNKKVRSVEHLAVVKVGKKGGKELRRYMLDGKLAEPPITILKVPPKLGGKKWPIESVIGKQVIKGKSGSAFFKPGDKEVVVTVPAFAGTSKKAFPVTSEGLVVNGVELQITFYYVENVGMVKMMVKMPLGKDKHKEVVFELEKFEKAQTKKE
jgi:hypothetical protein